MIHSELSRNKKNWNTIFVSVNVSVILINSIMATINVMLNDKPDRYGLYKIFIRITENRKHKKIKTDISLPKDHFNSKAKYGRWVRTSNPKYAQLNKELLDKIDSIQELIKELEQKKLSVTHHINKPSLEDITIKEYFEIEVKRCFVEHAYGYARQIESITDRFTQWLGPNFPLKDISILHIDNYKAYLLGKDLQNSSVNTNLTRIKTIISKAYNNEIIPNDPFRKNKRLKELPSNKHKLSDAQIMQLENINLPADGKMNWKSLARDMYLFSFYNAGIRIADILQLKVISIKNGRLEYEMDKTGFKKSIALNQKSKAILEKYISDKSNPHDYIFPVLDSSEPYAKAITHEEKRKAPLALREQLFKQISSKSFLANKALKSLAEDAGLPADISFHTSRHSFADKARRAMKDSKRVTITDIQSALGHKDLATTQRYIKTFDIESLDEAMNDIFD